MRSGRRKSSGGRSFLIGVVLLIAVALVFVLTDLMDRIYGGQVSAVVEADRVTFTAPDPTTTWAVASLSQASISSAGVHSVHVGAQSWTNEPMSIAQWQGTPGAQATTVVVVLRT